jgi:hypothetical protein
MTRPTEAVPAIEQLFPRRFARDRASIFQSGHESELYFVLEKAWFDALMRHEDPPLDLTIALPNWAIVALLDLLRDQIQGKTGRRKKGQRAWTTTYRAHLIHWHRFVLMDRAVTSGMPRRANKTTQSAAEYVSAQLKKTAFAAGPDQMDVSYSKVRRDLSFGRAYLYFRDDDILYEKLLNGGKPSVVKLTGTYSPPYQ